jgi:hypothetical protein
MKKILFILIALTLLQFNVNSQSCSTYPIQKNGLDNEWGIYNPGTGIVSGVSSISTPISDVDNPNSCIDGANGMIYFFEVTEVAGNGVFSIVSLNVNTGVSSKQSTTDGGVLEYSNNNGKLYIIQTDVQDDYQIGEVDPSTGVVSNVTTSSIPFGFVVGKSTLNEQNGEIYLVEENGASYSLISANLNSGGFTSQNISNIPSAGEIWYVEHNNITGITYVILSDATSWLIAELDPTTGALSSINMLSTIVDPPSGVSYMDEQNGILYYTVYGGSGGSVIGVDVTSSIRTKQSVPGDIYVLEHNNYACSPTGIVSEALSNEIMVFPIPFNNQLNVSTSDGSAITSVLIHSNLGQKVYASSEMDNVIHLDHALKTGLYIMEVTTERGEIIRKNIVKN